jgi:hypothetical protein
MFRVWPVVCCALMHLAHKSTAFIIEDRSERRVQVPIKPSPPTLALPSCIAKGIATAGLIAAIVTPIPEPVWASSETIKSEKTEVVAMIANKRNEDQHLRKEMNLKLNAPKNKIDKQAVTRYLSTGLVTAAASVYALESVEKEVSKKVDKKIKDKLVQMKVEQECFVAGAYTSLVAMAVGALLAVEVMEHF